MAAWFEDFPLDFTRYETRAAVSLIAAAYNTNDELLELADSVGLVRGKLSQNAVVNRLAREIVVGARLANRLTVLLAVALMDPEREAIHSSLRKLVVDHEAVIRQAALSLRPSLATLRLFPPEIESWGSGHPRPERGFEKMINNVAGFVDIATFRQGLVEAETRTARLEIGGRPRGTGFLVGPQLILTNWHVVEDDVNGAVARFDRSVISEGRVVAFADDWNVAHSMHDSQTSELCPDGPAEGTWDFALVKLAEPVGDEAVGPDPGNSDADRRGYYQLDWRPYMFGPAEPLLIVGHPAGGPIQLSYASPAGAKMTPSGNRVRYDTNTAGGSSGSPVFNRDFRIVALHHSAGVGAGPGWFNQGVPVAGIGEALRALLTGKPELTTLQLI